MATLLTQTFPLLEGREFQAPTKWVSHPQVRVFLNPEKKFKSVPGMALTLELDVVKLIDWLAMKRLVALALPVKLRELSPLLWVACPGRPAEGSQEL